MDGGDMEARTLARGVISAEIAQRRFKAAILQNALIEAVDLLWKISEKWEDALVMEYPRDLPSFDELVLKIKNIKFGIPEDKTI